MLRWSSTVIALAKVVSKNLGCQRLAEASKRVPLNGPPAGSELVGGWPTPLKKYHQLMIIPNIWKKNEKEQMFQTTNQAKKHQREHEASNLRTNVHAHQDERTESYQFQARTCLDMPGLYSTKKKTSTVLRLRSKTQTRLLDVNVKWSCLQIGNSFLTSC